MLYYSSCANGELMHLYYEEGLSGNGDEDIQE